MQHHQPAQDVTGQRMGFRRVGEPRLPRGGGTSRKIVPKPRGEVDEMSNFSDHGRSNGWNGAPDRSRACGGRGWRWSGFAVTGTTERQLDRRIWRRRPPRVDVGNRLQRETKMALVSLHASARCPKYPTSPTASSIRRRESLDSASDAFPARLLESRWKASILTLRNGDHSCAAERSPRFARGPC